MENIDKIALIAGSGRFPIFIARAAKADGLKVIAIAVNGEAEKEIERLANKTYWINLGEAKKLIETLKNENIRYAVMAGKINKITIIKESLRFDDEAKALLKNVIDKRDDTLLSAVSARLKDIGVELLDSTMFLRGLMPSKGALTKKRPDSKEQHDIDFGFKIAKEIGRLDIGQAVAIKNKAIIAVEGIEGTDEMIRRSGALAGSGIVIVKVSKPNQDMRFDVPVVGHTTIQALKEAGASCLAIEAEKVLVLEKDEVVKEADENSITIIAV